MHCYDRDALAERNTIPKATQPVAYCTSPSTCVYTIRTTDCARRIGQLRMLLSKPTVEVVEQCRPSPVYTLGLYVMLEWHACKQLAIVNSSSSSFSTSGIPEESPQSRRWDADFHTFVCRVVAVRVITTDDVLWYTANVYLLELYISLRWFWIIHVVESFEPDLNKL